MYTLIVGETYPGGMPQGEGAAAEFLNGRNRLLIKLPGMSKDEARAIRKGDIRCGLLNKSGAIMLLISITYKGNLFFEFDCPFDARLISDMDECDITNSQQRLAIEIVAVDSATKLIRALRFQTMPPGLTVAFLSAVQDQLVSPAQPANMQLTMWKAQPISELIKKVEMWRMGT